MRPPQWIWRWTAGAVALWWAGVLAANAVRALHDLLVIVLISFFLASALEQPVTRMERRGMRRGFATGLVLGATLLLLIAVIAAGGALIASQISSLTGALPDLSRSVSSIAATFGFNIDPQLPATELANLINNELTQNAGALLVKTTALLGQTAIGALITFYLVADGPRLRRNVCSFLPPARQQNVLAIWTATIDKAGGYLLVRGVLAAASAVISSVFLTLAGVDYAFALGLWVGIVSQAIPAIGTYIAGTLPLLVAANETSGTFIATLLFLIAYQLLENYVLAPRIAAKVMELHAAIGFTAAVAGAYIAGAAGALIAVPAVAVAQAIISASAERHQLVENELLNHNNNHQKLRIRKRATKKAAAKRAAVKTTEPKNTDSKATQPKSAQQKTTQQKTVGAKNVKSGSAPRNPRRK